MKTVEQFVGPGEASPIMVRRTTLRSFTPGRAIAGLLGAFLVGVGSVAMSRTGVDGDTTTPLTSVLGVTQSAGVGIVEVVIELIMVASAFDFGPPIGTGVLGIFGLAAGLLVAFASPDSQRDFGFGPSTGWFFVVWGAIAILAAMLPVVWQREQHIDAVG